MKNKLISAFLVMTILFSSSVDAALYSSDTAKAILQLISKLSDDIGKMADRIGEMSDDIGKMADRIGEMSDRIVHTEELMAKLTVDLADRQNGTANTIIITSSNTKLYNPEDIPSFNINKPTKQILVYFSPNLNFTTNTIAILVNTSNFQEIVQQWDEIKKLAKNNKINIAIKTINGNTVSSLSNVLTFYLADI